MFLVYLSSENNVNERGNCYGYFTGKCYTKDGGVFPITDDRKTERTKFYTSEKRAIRGAEAILDKCGYVASYKIEKV